ncbi:MAG: KpsF/GutQ family sugar-phosphate isomerase, partial [Planctomycetia bacterium]|nr:KpsF/GutQ family sugar-phosphate isomerase [Planctomycetia bacterium]
LTDADIVAHGREILRAEGEAIVRAAEHLGDAFARAVRLVVGCTGSVVVTGIGKAGLVARKISATLASTGTPSHFLHPAEAMHGDLGALRADDVVLALSQSGETEEIARILPHVAARGIRIVALTGSPHSALGRAAEVVVLTGSIREACALGLAPSTSTALMLALGDALALVTSSLRRFTHEDFAARHPGGSLGRQLMLVEDAMRPLAQCRTARPADTVRDVFVRPLPARRTGAVMIVDERGRLAGIFTDSDLARLFERRNDAALDQPIGRVMTARPTTAASGSRLRDALALLEARRLSELPVVDDAGRLIGLLDIVDLVGLVPSEMLELPAASTLDAKPAAA